VARVAEALLDLGCYEVSLGDTLGRAAPEQVAAMLAAALQAAPPERLAGHYHDTGGKALANIAVSLEMGLRVFDASIAGLGGCPYAPGAKGNVATEAVARFLREAGYETGIDLIRLQEAANLARSLLSDGSDEENSL
jgi:hydroxymethylglutaryl-CoA lyase